MAMNTHKFGWVLGLTCSSLIAAAAMSCGEPNPHSPSAQPGEGEVIAEKTVSDQGGNSLSAEFERTDDQDPAKTPAPGDSAGLENVQAGSENPEGEAYPNENEYNPIGKRDVFESIFESGDGPIITNVPGPGRVPEGPLQKYEVEEYKVTGIIWAVAAPSAVLVDPAGDSHLVKPGALIGKNWGKVTRIKKDGIVIEERVGGMHPGIVELKMPLRQPRTGTEDETGIVEEAGGPGGDEQPAGKASKNGDGGSVTGNRGERQILDALREPPQPAAPPNGGHGADNFDPDEGNAKVVNVPNPEF